MSPFLIVLKFLLVTFTAGILGTMAMTAALDIINRSKLANADMVRAIGSMFTKSIDDSFLVGLLLHCISGVCFAMGYALLMSLLGLTGVIRCMWFGTLFGFAHGFVMSFILIIWVAENHPLPEFQNAGIGVAVGH